MSPAAVVVPVAISDRLLDIVAAMLFAAALAHVLAAPWVHRLAGRAPRHAGLWHLLGEVEVAFVLWAAIYIGVIAVLGGMRRALDVLESAEFTEPLFVFAIMLVAGSRPLLALAEGGARRAARWLPLAPGIALHFVVLAAVPLLGSLITEPAAMTLAALMLRQTVFTDGRPVSLKYATLGVLFVNVSIGGTLTPFAAPPVLMVAGKWDWGFAFMLSTFGWKAAIACVVNAALVTAAFAGPLREAGVPRPQVERKVPRAVIAVHVALLAATVALAHHVPAFIGVLLLFLGFRAAYPAHQGPLVLREALLVGAFLAGLVVLGGGQRWWIQPFLSALDADTVFFGAAALTAVTDNAALTYLGSLVDGLAPDFKVALVAGAVTGGGLTVIANAPNPAGAAFLRDGLPGHSVDPLKLFAAALAPTLVAALAFRLL